MIFNQNIAFFFQEHNSKTKTIKLFSHPSSPYPFESLQKSIFLAKILPNWPFKPDVNSCWEIFKSKIEKISNIICKQFIENCTHNLMT